MVGGAVLVLVTLIVFFLAAARDATAPKSG